MAKLSAQKPLHVSVWLSMIYRSGCHRERRTCLFDHEHRSTHPLTREHTSSRKADKPTDGVCFIRTTPTIHQSSAPLAQQLKNSSSLTFRIEQIQLLVARVRSWQWYLRSVRKKIQRDHLQAGARSSRTALEQDPRRGGDTPPSHPRKASNDQHIQFPDTMLQQRPFAGNRSFRNEMDNGLLTV